MEHNFKTCSFLVFRLQFDSLHPITKFHIEEDFYTDLFCVYVCVCVWGGGGGGAGGGGGGGGNERGEMKGGNVVKAIFSA